MTAAGDGGVRLVLPLGAGQMLIGPAGAAHLDRALAAAERGMTHDGIPPPTDWRALRQAVAQAAGEARALADESRKARLVAAQAASIASSSSLMMDPIGTVEAARLLDCSVQWTRSLCRRSEFTSARRRSGRWVVDRDEVLARAASTRAAAGGHLATAT